MEGNELLEYKRTAPRILCDDYPVGPFSLVSYEPVLKWRIVRSGIPEALDGRLPRDMMITAILGGKHKITLHASPYSYGQFCMECRSLGVSLHYHTFDTHDPEEAVFKAEIYMKRIVDAKISFYSSLANSLTTPQIMQ